MAQQLLQPSFLDTSLRSTLFRTGQRRVGKTTFLATDLIPALEDKGAIVIYVDLWSQLRLCRKSAWVAPWQADQLWRSDAPPDQSATAYAAGRALVGSAGHTH